ncbi:6-bladed beta-propeller [Mucilaginibacter daejeonensis]|uniref:6-bladed beta-propeller n=1 Tax=Mucilaginibacter daejeonensis TaxID=398049 RepID=UPI001D17A04B|nr:6-bladed beta-propeller [Mucilaginibacter daejeonensis]UEG54023.1 6-bladed beta-propeller [Mucilaginibacter daejeonensis]
MKKSTGVKTLICCLILLSSLGNVVAQEINKIRVDPNQAYGGAVSEYFTTVEYIPLESNKQSTFGYITRLIVTDSSFVVYDSDTYSVYFFSLSGRFIRKVKGKAEGLGQNIDYDKKAGYIDFSRVQRSTNKLEHSYFSKTGEELSKNFIPHAENDFADMLPLGDNFYASANGCFISNIDKTKSTIINRLEIYNNGKLYKTLLPINQQENEAICAIHGFLRLPEKSENNSFYISTPLDYFVYKINKDSAKLVFQFVFPADRIFSNDILKSHDKKLIREIAEKNILNPDPLKIMNVSNIFCRGENIFFKINPKRYVSSQGSAIQYQYNFIYNKISGRLISLERLIGDESNFYLPIFNDRVKVDGLEQFDDGFYYSNISSYNMFAAASATKLKKPQYPDILQNFFKTGNRRSNPVIVRMKLKE